MNDLLADSEAFKEEGKIEVIVRSVKLVDISIGVLFKVIPLK